MKFVLAVFFVFISVACTNVRTIEGYQHEKLTAQETLPIEPLSRDQYVIGNVIEGVAHTKGNSQDFDEEIKDAIRRGKSIAVFNALEKEKQADAMLLPKYKYTATQTDTWFWFIFIFHEYRWNIEVTVVGRAMRLKTDEELGRQSATRKNKPK